ncbi:hypothetical protein CGRA01v4_04313 [Colletotrichum graminicola]|uniref:Mtf2-like C-terminal domain-containing protein n=1 Tax=Colletotrichum graminicola (strain M1.001 / M2 / FGSC 10212) TaxID=645133 RepID=E3Q976_COLGM|nr:uncharacterized protein GLRG_01750 [Colletotrichum graminicola M1.001]EFQ27255.1 hypothetical protein GLRG_01750 [Colletotrichum graminicola M1.001]WDK13032.1 hypothetical protein CGRA01v4_04313 [Colletotrichum graminicola]
MSATTLTPFLYQTRTILRASAALRSLSTSAARPHAYPRTRGEQSIPFEWDSPANEQPDIPSGLNNPEKSTITPTEKFIFQNIFADIAKRSGRQDPHAAATHQEGESGPRDAILSKFPRSLRRAAQAALELREAPFDDSSSFRTSFVTEEQHHDSDADLEAEKEQAARLEAAHNEIRTHEIVRLQALLDQCNTDVEVWDVLERDVFSMVAKLGISEDSQQVQPPPQTAKKGKGRPKRVEKEAAATTSGPSLAMESHGPLYSMHLLQGLKTLDQSFARSSALALDVLPRVKELGLASYVLGVSTPFYNELASIFWYRHGDTQAVLDVLDEMQFAGLSYDKQTLRLVDTIEMALASFRRGQLGIFSKAIGAMPGYNLDVKSRVERYGRRVRRNVKEQNDNQARY